MQEKLLRLIDANYNRAREGLRVIEDVMRFIFENQVSARKAKLIRQNVAQEIKKIPLKELLEARDVEDDLLKFDDFRLKIDSIETVLRMNFQRVTEALRVIEEVIRILKPNQKKQITKLRFKVYQLEKDILGKLK